MKSMPEDYDEIFTRIQEEAGELNQVICKARIFGLDNKYEGQTNAEYIHMELIDLWVVIGVALDRFQDTHLPKERNDEYIDRKVQRLKQHSPLFAEIFKDHEGN